MFKNTNKVRLIAINGRSFEIIRNTVTVCNANGTINTEMDKKVIHFLLSTDIKGGDWAKLLSTGELFYILKTEIENQGSDSQVINAFYQTENDYYISNNRIRENIVSDGSGLPDKDSAIDSPVNNREIQMVEIMQLIEAHDTEDKSELSAIISQVYSWYLSSDNLSPGSLSAYKAAIQKNPWIIDPAAKLILNMLIE